MTSPDLRSHSVPALPPDLRLSAICRRISASGPIASVISDLAFGARQRDHAEALHHVTGARVAEAARCRS